jgi:hypothetical protein
MFTVIEIVDLNTQRKYRAVIGCADMASELITTIMLNMNDYFVVATYPCNYDEIPSRTKEESEEVSNILNKVYAKLHNLKDWSY